MVEKSVAANGGSSGGICGGGSKENSSLVSGSSEPVKLKKELGLFHGCCFIIGIVVGSGIFVSPKGVLLEAGSPGLSIIVWALCGMMALVGAMCYAELGTCIPNSGADYAYINNIYGGFPAFLYLWVANIIVIPTGNAITALTFANYILNLFFQDCGPPSKSVTVLAATCVGKYLCTYIIVKPQLRKMNTHIFIYSLFFNAFFVLCLLLLSLINLFLD